MKTWLVGVMFAAACSSGPKQDTMPPLARQLGESTKSPGADPTKPTPVTADDPKVMNVSASITPSQLQQAQGQPVPTQPTASREAATSSTPVTPPADIAPRSTATETNRPTVNSPPPPPPPRTP